MVSPPTTKPLMSSTLSKATITLEEIHMLLLFTLTVFVGVLLLMAAFIIYSNSRTMFKRN